MKDVFFCSTERFLSTEKPFTHQSMFWSDLGPNVGYEAIGMVDATLPTVGVFAKLPERSTINTTQEGDKPPSQSENVPAVEQTSSTATTTIIEPRSASEMDNFNKGVVFYMKDGKVVGIVLWNVFNRINVARAIIAEGRKYDDLNEVAKLFEIHA